MSQLKSGAQSVVKKPMELLPDNWDPGVMPDPLIRQKHGHIGVPVSRRDGEFKVRGEATFAAEFPVKGMLYASLAYSTIAKGRIVALDTSAAEIAPGVALVMTHRNAPRMKPTPVFLSHPKAVGPSSLLPKPPPTYGDVTCTRSSVRPKIWASVHAVCTTVWDAS